MAFGTRQQKPQVSVAPIDQALPQREPGRQRGNWRPLSFNGENSRFVNSRKRPGEDGEPVTAWGAGASRRPPHWHARC